MAVDLYWLPLGAGWHFVRRNGRVFEALAALIERRQRYDLYHSALEVRVGKDMFVVEMMPVRDPHGSQHGRVSGGAVGSRWLRGWRMFRYEIRRWRDGQIPDVAEAVESPQRLTDDEDCGRRLLDLVPTVPTPVWGRDEFDTGDMWNSNSVTSWLIARSGIETGAIHPPAGGRAPGWQAGLTTARRSG